MNQISGNSIAWLKTTEPDAITPTANDLDLMVLVRLVRRRLGVILGVTALVTLLSLPYILSMVPVYQAEARFLVTPVLSVEDGQPAEVFVMSDEVERLRARTVVERVVDRLNLTGKPEFNPALAPVTGLSRLHQRISPADAGPTPPGDATSRAVAAVYGRLSVWRQTENILQLTFRSTDPEVAAAVPNAIIASYVDEVTAHRDARVTEALDQLRLRAQDQAARTAQARADIAALRTAQAGVAGGSDAAADETQLTMLNQQLADLQARRADLAATVATVEANLNDNGPAPLNETAAVTQLRQSLDRQERDLAHLTSLFGDGYGGVQTQRAQVADLKDAIRRELSNWAASMRAQLVHIDQEEAALQAKRGTAQGQLTRLSAGELDMANLVARADDQATKLDTVNDQIRLLETVLRRPAVNVDVLTPAAVPLWPEGRGRKVYLLIAILGGAVLGLTCAGVLDLTDRTVRSPRQLAADPSVLPVGLLPQSRRTGRARTRPATDTRLTHAADRLVRGIAASSGGEFPRSLLITATRRGDGCRFVAAAIGQALSANGRQILIVDTLPQRRRFGLSQAKDKRAGFAEYLRGQVNIDAAMRRDPATGQMKMSRGTGPLPPLYDDAPIKALIAAAAARGLCVVIIGTPPRDSVSVDRIAGAVSQVLLVTRWGRTPRDLVAQTLDELREQHIGRILTVINRVKPRRYALYNVHAPTLLTGPKRSNSW